MLTKNDKERPLLKDLLSDPFIRKTMKEFVESKGQDVKSERIPIKKTLTHQEFKKILDEDTKNQEEDENSNETPYQRMQRRKFEQNRKQEEEMKQAARQAHLGKMEHKQRKYDDLFGSSPTIKKGDVMSNNSQLNNNSQMIAGKTQGQALGKSSLAPKNFQETNRGMYQNEQKMAYDTPAKYEKVNILIINIFCFYEIRVLLDRPCFKLAKAWSLTRVRHSNQTMAKKQIMTKRKPRIL